MRTETVLILERQDMRLDSKSKSAEEITRYDIKEFQKFNTANLVLFLDENGDCKILKSRYGKVK